MMSAVGIDIKAILIGLILQYVGSTSTLLDFQVVGTCSCGSVSVTSYYSGEITYDGQCGSCKWATQGQQDNIAILLHIRNVTIHHYPAASTGGSYGGTLRLPYTRYHSEWEVPNCHLYYDPDSTCDKEQIEDNITNLYTNCTNVTSHAGSPPIPTGTFIQYSEVLKGGYAKFDIQYRLFSCDIPTTTTKESTDAKLLTTVTINPDGSPSEETTEKTNNPHYTLPTGTGLHHTKMPNLSTISTTKSNQQGTNGARVQKTPLENILIPILVVMLVAMVVIFLVFRYQRQLKGRKPAGKDKDEKEVVENEIYGQEFRQQNRQDVENVPYEPPQATEEEPAENCVYAVVNKNNVEKQQETDCVYAAVNKKK